MAYYYPFFDRRNKFGDSRSTGGYTRRVNLITVPVAMPGKYPLALFKKEKILANFRYSVTKQVIYRMLNLCLDHSINTTGF